MTTDIVRRLYEALPPARAWIDQFLADHASTAQPITSLGCTRLAACFPPEFLEKSKIVRVNRVIVPPVEQFGLPEFSFIHRERFEGITFKDTIFIRRDMNYEGLYFHELVHVAQWARLGVDNFLLAYGLGLSQHSYRNSPFESMAYTLQTQFEADTLQSDLIAHIGHLTDLVWADAQRILKRP